MNPRMIVIDGKTYHSVDEMPPDVRQRYEEIVKTLGDANGNQILDAFEGGNLLSDADRDGIPDVFESFAATNTVASTIKIIADGKEYNSLEDLPPEARARYEQAMGKLDANRDGVPDVVEGMFVSSSQTASVVSTEASRRSIPSPAPTITPDTSNGWMLVLSGLLIFLLCAAGVAGLWYFFLR